MIFTGAVKRRDEVPQLRFEIPTLAPAKQVIRAIAKLWEWVDTTGMTNTDVNNRYAEGVIKACASHFRDLVPPRDGEDNGAYKVRRTTADTAPHLYTHLFRAIYATIACHWFCPPHVSVLEYRAYIQGHFKILDEQDPTLRRTLASDRHYFDYQISDGKGNVDGRLGIKLALPSVEVLEAFKPQSEISNSLPVLEPEREPELESKPEDESLTQLIPKIKKLLESDRYTLLLTGLMAATGRSPGELLKAGTFQRTDHPKVVHFSPTGIGAKSSLMTLIEADSVLDALSRLREHLDVQNLLYLAPNDIDAHCLPHIIRTMRHHLPFRELNQMQAAYSTLTNASTAPLTFSPSQQPETGIYHVYEDDKERLSAIAQQFNCLNQASTVTTVLDWAEAACQLAQRFQLQSPQQLLTLVEEKSSQTPQPQPLPLPDSQELQIPQLEPIPVLDTPEVAQAQPPTERTERLEAMFIAQQQSLAQLTEAIFHLVSTLTPDAKRSSSRSVTTAPPQPKVTDNPPQASTEATKTMPQSSKPSSGVAASIAKVNAYINAIMHYNNEVATTKKDKWAVSISALKQLTKCNQDLIKRVIQNRSDEIDAHHAQNELGQFQNSKGKLAPSISEVIKPPIFLTEKTG